MLKNPLFRKHSTGNCFDPTECIYLGYFHIETMQYVNFNLFPKIKKDILISKIWKGVKQQKEYLNQTSNKGVQGRRNKKLKKQCTQMLSECSSHSSRSLTEHFDSNVLLWQSLSHSPLKTEFLCVEGESVRLQSRAKVGKEQRETKWTCARWRRLA